MCRISIHTCQVLIYTLYIDTFCYFTIIWDYEILDRKLKCLTFLTTHRWSLSQNKMLLKCFCMDKSNIVVHNVANVDKSDQLSK